MSTTVLSSDFPCPCQSGSSYHTCCGVIHQDHSRAKRPEQLMRARYSAYVLHLDDFILKSWSFETRPAKLTLNSKTKWLSLEILSTELGTVQAKQSSVCYRATFLEDHTLYRLEELSRFTSHYDRWFYVDGDTEMHAQNIGNNMKCPCNSGKKFKRCCLQR